MAMPVADLITCELTVPAPPREAHQRFAYGTAGWWPSSYAWAPRDPDAAAPHRRACAFGDTLVERPGELHLFRWEAGRGDGPRAFPASVVAVRFRTEGRLRTRVRLAHAGLLATGPDGWFEWSALSSPEGWSGLLDAFARSLGRAPDPGAVVRLPAPAR